MFAARGTWNCPVNKNGQEAECPQAMWIKPKAWLHTDQDTNAPGKLSVSRSVPQSLAQ